MDKAASAVRRGSVRLSSLGSGHSELKLVISESKNVKKSWKNVARAQQGASSYLSKWAESEENVAIQDVISHITELHSSWTDIQKDLICGIKKNAIVYERILDAEKALDQAKKYVESCQAKEKKIKKEIERLEKKGEDSSSQQMKLEKANQAAELAVVELEGCHRETEAAKASLLRTALSEYAESFQRMAAQCGIVFAAQQKLADLIPKFHARDLSVPQYEGSSQASLIVRDAHFQLRTGAFPFESSTSFTEEKEPLPPSYSSVHPDEKLEHGHVVAEDMQVDIGWGSDEFDD